MIFTRSHFSCAVAFTSWLGPKKRTLLVLVLARLSDGDMKEDVTSRTFKEITSPTQKTTMILSHKFIIITLTIPSLQLPKIFAVKMYALPMHKLFYDHIKSTWLKRCSLTTVDWCFDQYLVICNNRF